MIGLLGNTNEGVPIAIVATDAPYRMMSAPGSKEAVERAHLTKYRADLVAYRGADDYLGEPEHGPDPPDFWIGLPEGGRAGLELTQLVSGPRRDGEARTRQLLSAIDARSEDLLRLDGWTIHLWRHVDRMPAMPTSFDRKALNELVDALADADPAQHVFGPFPEGLPPEIQLPHCQLSSGYAFYASEGSTGVPRGRSAVRFDVAYHFQTDLRKDELVSELQRVVSQHDRQTQSSHLIVTIGGPDQDGLGYLTERQILPLLQSPSREEVGIPDPRYLDLVRLHDWATGQIVQLFPHQPIATPAPGDP